MEGKYKTQDGIEVNIICFDHPNSMAYVDFGEGGKRWIAKMEYEKWMPAIYIPDIPAQIIYNDKIENDAVQIETANEVDVCEQTTDGEGMGSGNAEPQIIAKQENKVTSEEKDVVDKPKRKYNKKK